MEDNPSYVYHLWPNIEAGGVSQISWYRGMVNKVEVVQSQSARYVMKDYSRYSSVTTML